MDWLSAFGSIASIGGAIWAVREARESKSWAEKSARIHTALIQRRGLAEVSRIHSETKRVLRIAREIGPGATEEQLRGKHCGQIIDEVERYVDLVVEHRDYFRDLDGNPAAEMCETLSANIEALSQAKTSKSIKQVGSSICYAIQSFVPIAKAHTDSRHEQKPNN